MSSKQLCLTCRVLVIGSCYCSERCYNTWRYRRYRQENPEKPATLEDAAQLERMGLCNLSADLQVKS